MTATESTFTVLPTGDYLFQITDYIEEDGTFGPQFKFNLEVVSPKKNAGESKPYWASKKLTGGKKPSKLFALVEAAYNRPLGKNEQVDIDDLIGRQIIGAVIVENKDGSDINKIASIKAYGKQEAFPLPTASAAAAAAPAEDDDPFEDQ